MKKVKQSTVIRTKLANPFSDIPMMDRLIAAESIDLRDNHKIEDLGNGYVKIVPIDANKRFSTSNLDSV